MLGDFDEILSNLEKYGGNLISEYHLAEFRHVIEEFNLCNLDFRGNIFIWNNGREGDGLMCERLDRCLASLEWRGLFPSTQLHMV